MVVGRLAMEREQKDTAIWKTPVPTAIYISDDRPPVHTPPRPSRRPVGGLVEEPPPPLTHKALALVDPSCRALDGAKPALWPTAPLCRSSSIQFTRIRIFYPRFRLRLRLPSLALAMYSRNVCPLGPPPSPPTPTFPQYYSVHRRMDIFATTKVRHATTGPGICPQSRFLSNDFGQVRPRSTPPPLR